MKYFAPLYVKNASKDISKSLTKEINNGLEIEELRLEKLVLDLNFRINNLKNIEKVKVKGIRNER